MGWSWQVQACLLRFRLRLVGEVQSSPQCSRSIVPALRVSIAAQVVMVSELIIAAMTLQIAKKSPLCQEGIVRLDMKAEQKPNTDGERNEHDNGRAYRKLFPTIDGFLRSLSAIEGKPPEPERRPIGLCHGILIAG